MSEPYVGEIRIFAGNFAPAGWFLCDGSQLSINEYETLFQLIGTTYGGDGQTTFALPDMRGRVPVHQGNGMFLGASGGVETVTLSLAQMPVHSHVAQGSSLPATDPNPAGNVWAGFGDSPYSDQAANTTMASSAISNVGGSQPHENRAPSLAVNYIISAFGIFPSST